MARWISGLRRAALVGTALAVPPGCTPSASTEDSGTTPLGDGAGAAAAECPAIDDFQDVCACSAVEMSWTDLGLSAGTQLSALTTAFMEGDAESISAAACAGTLTREDIVDAYAYELSGRSDGSATVTLDLREFAGLAAYSFLSDGRGQPLGFAYFVVSSDSGSEGIELQDWYE